ncbi:MAG: hypothetical protein ABI321_01755 [Polyangia bacterium]
MRRVVIALLVACHTFWNARPSRACSFVDEPKLPVLLQRAIATAALEPGRTASMLRRARGAAALPRVQALVGKGRYDYIRNADSLAPTLVSSDTWRIELTATWQLDHLVFHPSEPRLVQASGRVAERRAQLVERVVDVWTQRRALDRPGPLDAAAADRCEALTATLDLMTDGALSEGRAGPAGTISLPTPKAATR